MKPAVFRKANKIYLRALERDDVERCLRWVSTREVTDSLLIGRFPLNRARQQEWVDSLYKDETGAVFAICLSNDDRHIGNCGLHGISVVDRHATVGILIGDPSDHGKGYGTEAMRLVIDYAFDTLNLHRLDLSVFDFNAAALRVYRNLGFTEEGRLRQHRFRRGRYCDEISMGLLRDEWTSPSAGSGVQVSDEEHAESDTDGQ